MKTKVCRVCKKRLSISSFYADGHGGKRSECKDCHKASKKKLKNTPFKTAGRPTPEGCKRYEDRVIWKFELEWTMDEVTKTMADMRYRLINFYFYKRLSIITSILSLLLASGLVYVLVK